MSTLPTPDALAEELRTAPTMELGLHPVTLFQLVALVQLALRHPDVGVMARDAGERFLAAARSHFVNQPAIVRVIDAGDDPAQDLAREDDWQ